MIIKGDDFIVHYFYLKELYNLNIDKFLKENKDVSIKCKAKKAVQLTERPNELEIPPKTEKGKFIRRLERWKKYNKTQMLFWIFHLRLQLIRKLKYHISNLKTG